MADTKTRRGDNAKNEARDNDGRFKRGDRFELPEITGRSAAIGAAVLAAGIGLGAALFSNWKRSEALPSEPWSGNTDAAETMLANDDTGGMTERAPDAFRPDVDAPIAEDKRGAFAPATFPAPTREQAAARIDV